MGSWERTDSRGLGALGKAVEACVDGICSQESSRSFFNRDVQCRVHPPNGTTPTPSLALRRLAPKPGREHWDGTPAGWGYPVRVERTPGPLDVV